MAGWKVMENHGKSWKIQYTWSFMFFFESNINMGHLGHFALSDYWRVSGWNVRESIGLRENLQETHFWQGVSNSGRKSLAEYGLMYPKVLYIHMF